MKIIRKKKKEKVKQQQGLGALVKGNFEIKAKKGEGKRMDEVAKKREKETKKEDNMVTSKGGMKIRMSEWRKEMTEIERMKKWR